MLSSEPVLLSDDVFANQMIELNTWSCERQEWKMQAIPIAHLNLSYQFQSVYASISSNAYNTESMNINSLVVEMCLNDLISLFKFLSLKNLRRLCDIHVISYQNRNKQQLTNQLLNHMCSTFCGTVHIVIFKCLSQPRSVPTFSVNIARSAAGSSDDLAPSTNMDGLVGGDTPTNSYDHLKLLTDDERRQLYLDFKEATSTEALKSGVCAACARRSFQTSLKVIDPSPKILELLHDSTLSSFLHPRTYDFQLYGQALLHPEGLKSTKALDSLQVCAQCYRALKDDKTPRFALANKLYTAHEVLPAPVLQAIDNLTVAERMLLSRARYNKICCRFQSPGSKASAKEKLPPPSSRQGMLIRARKGVRGNVMVVPLDTVRMNNVLPPPASVIRDTLCAVFVGVTKPQADEILNRKNSPMLVRRSRIKTVIDFLLANNPQYQQRENFFGFSSKNFGDILSAGEQGVPSTVEIGYIDSNDAVAISTADYTPRNDNSGVYGGVGELLMENVGYTDGDTSATNYYAMKAFALERCRRGKPFILSGSGNTPVPEFQNPNILTWLFPNLDPWGIAGFNHVGRKIKLSIEEQLCYFLQLQDPRFQADPEFAFVFFNVVRKLKVAQSIRFSVKPSIHRKLAVDMMAIEPETLQLLGKKLESNPLYSPASPAEQKAYQVMSSLAMIARQIPGSNGYKVHLRNQIRAIISYRGTPTIFITLNPADVDNPIVRLLAGEDINLEDISRGEDMDIWERKMFAAQHPGACAQFFHLMMTTFIKVALRFGSNPPQPGVFGLCDAYYGTVEAQGKGTLHCHMLLWLQGHLSPQKLRDAMAGSESYRDRVFQWAESVIKCELPVETAGGGCLEQPLERIRYFDIGNPHPGTMPGPLAIQPLQNGEYDWSEFREFLSQLLIEYNWHVHNEVCWKYLRRGEQRNDQSCRLRMNGVTRDHTILDEETGGLLLQRHHPRIAAYNDLVTMMMKSNTEVKYIGSGRAARDLVFYITDYVTKPTLPVHVGMAALQYAITKANDTMAERTDGYTADCNIRTVTTAVNSMMGRHEISQPQVMSYLIGGGDHYTSEKFSTLNWGQVLAYVDSVIPKPSDGVTVEDEFAPLDTSFDVAVRDDSVTSSSQVLDYMFRNEHQSFDRLCLYDFAAQILKSVIPKILLRHNDTSQIEGSFSSWDHPQRGTHYLRHRQLAHIPVLLGPTIPNPERSPDVRETWAKCILVLFKPWRHPKDIKTAQQTWIDAYEQYKVNLSVPHLSIIRNMNAFAESKDARGSTPSRSLIRHADDNANMDHLSSAAYNTDGAMNDMMSVEGDDLENEEGPGMIQDVFLCTDQSLSHSRILDDIASRCLGHGVVESLNACQDLSVMVQDDVVSHDHNAMEVREHDLPDIRSYEASMKEKRAHKVVRGPNSDAGGRPCTSNRLNERRVVNPFVEVMAIDTEDQYSRSFPRRIGAAAVPDIVNSIIEKMNLATNAEQLKAFNTIADHLIAGKTDQLRMYISGVGGTGKSHVIGSIVALFELLGVRDQLLLGAPTGIASVLIRGQTLHSLSLINPAGRTGNLEGLTAMWKDVRYLIIDEVSMIGARFLSLLSNRIREAKYHHPESCSQPFGGVNIIFLGDFGQLKPPAQCSLYAHSIIKTPAFRTASSVDGISAMNGILLWRQVTEVVELVQNHRQSNDPVYANFLSRIRLGICTPHPNSFAVNSSKNDWTYILDRLMSNLDESTLKTFEDAPIIVGNKYTRDILNAKRIMHHSSRLGRGVHLYHSVDTIKRVPIRSGLRNGLWNINSSLSHDAFGRLPLFSGMRVMVTENIAFSDGVVNGSEGIVKTVFYNEGLPGVKVAVMALVYIAGCGIHLSGLDPDVVPIFPVSTRINHKIKVDAQTSCSGFTRRQLPLVPAYAYTDFKSQGRTLTNVIVDLYTARGQGVYVMLSRVKSIAGLAVLRWFPPSKIYSRLPAELREELKRLQLLSRA